MDSSSFSFFMSDIWPAVLEECKKNVATEAAYRLWISSLAPQSFENGRVRLATHEFKKTIITEKFLSVIKAAFMSVLGFDIDIEIIAVRDESEDEEADTAPKSFESTFDTFIVGSSNRLAYAAASAVAKNPGGVHNPLFIYGRSGLGKTHLLTAIQKEILKVKPKTNILYTNGESFTNDLIAHVSEKKMSDFHKNYRNADVLLFDDVQFIAGKIQTQEEFFHTFNALINSGKQIVLTSDRPPKDIERLEERLTSRFEQGLLVDIQPPDFETRMAIIKRKSLALGLQLPDDVVEYIAEKLKTNIRQLEGAVKKIHAITLIDPSIPPIVLANEAIKDVLTVNRPISVTVGNIIEQVGKTFGVSAEDIRSDKKKAAVSNSRQFSMYVIREITNLSLEAIGKEFGGKNHSTVLYSIEAVQKKMEQNPALKATLFEIMKNVQEN